MNFLLILFFFVISIIFIIFIIMNITKYLYFTLCMISNFIWSFFEMIGDIFQRKTHTLYANAFWTINDL